MKECEGESERIFPFILDVTNQESVDNAYTFVLSHLTTCFGAEKGLDALVNNAGIIYKLQLFSFVQVRLFAMSFSGGNNRCF